MIRNPFTLFAPFSDRFSVVLSAKEDDWRTDAQAATALGTNNAVGLEQVHGRSTVRVEDPSQRTQKADGMVSDTKGLALCIRAADCQSFVVYAPKKHVAGVLHAGWRGLLAGAIPEFFSVLKLEWDIDPSDVLVGCGPSLGVCCSEFGVDHEVLEALDKDCVEGRFADLRKAANKELFLLGVKPDHFERMEDITCCNADFWSYRGGDKEAVLDGHTNMLACVLS